MALCAAISLARGGIIVASTCVTGDLLLAMAKNRGVRALVTDGRNGLQSPKFIDALLKSDRVRYLDDDV